MEFKSSSNEVHKTSLSKLFTTVIDISLIFGAFGLSALFIINSLNQKDAAFTLVYIVTFIFIVIHYVIRSRFPNRFVRVAKESEEIDPFRSRLGNIIITLSFCIASAATISALLFPSRFGFFYDKITPIIEENMVFVFSYFFVLLFLLLGTPLILNRLFPYKNGSKDKVKPFWIVGTIFVLIFVFLKEANPTLIESLIENQFVEEAVVWILGIPVTFWLKYIFLGNIEGLKEIR